jgi:hypothetical protein
VDSFADAGVGATTAEIAGQRLVHGAVVRVRVARQQGDHRKDHARSAVAALGSAEFDEGLLDRVQPAVAHEPFDGGDVLPCDVGYLLLAGAHGPVVDKYGAGPALPLPATGLGTCQAQLATQHRQE